MSAYAAHGGAMTIGQLLDALGFAVFFEYSPTTNSAEVWSIDLDMEIRRIVVDRLVPTTEFHALILDEALEWVGRRTK